jgi:hypothetical protein
MLAAIIVIPMILLAQWIRVFLLLRGARQWPAPEGSAAGLLERPLSASELAAIAELESWGFARVRDGIDDTGWEPPRAVFLAHCEQSHFARLRLQGSVVTGLPVLFVSFAADGTPIATSNRLGWASVAGCDSLNTVDARADSVEAQWAFHRERAAQAQPLDAQVAADRLDADFHPLSAKAEDDEDGFEPWRAPELALALHAAHDDAAARRLCLDVGRDACESAAERTPGDVVADGPWQARHARERAALARTLVGDSAASSARGHANSATP